MTSLSGVSMQLKSIFVIGCAVPVLVASALGEFATNDSAAVVLPSELPKFPPLASSDTGNFLPATNGSYGFSLMPVDKTCTRITEAWVHRVTMRIPGRSEDEGQSVGTLMGFTNVPRRAGSGEMRNGNAVLRQALWHDTHQPYAYYFKAENAAYAELKRGKYDVQWWQEGGGTNQYEFGKEEMRKLGIWPEYATGEWRLTSDPQGYEKRFELEGGQIEGVPLVFAFRYHVYMKILRTKHLGGAKARVCKTQRYAKVKTKTIEEAFDELNRGFGSRAYVDQRGLRLQFDGVRYGMDGLSDDWMYPVYRFFGTDSSGYSNHWFVIPAMASDYFVDPARQVVNESMLTRKEDGSRVVDAAKVAALRIDPEVYLARIEAESRVRLAAECRNIVGESCVVVIGRLERGKVAGEWEVKAEQTFDFSDWFLVPEFRKKQLKGPVLLSASPLATTNGVKVSDDESLYGYGFTWELPPVYADERLGAMAARGRVIVFRMRFHDEVWSERRIVSWRYVPEMLDEEELCQEGENDRLEFRFPRRNLLSEHGGETDHQDFCGPVHEQLEDVVKCVEEVKKRREDVIKELRSKPIDERISIAKGRSSERGLEVEWSRAALARDPEVRVRRELASSPNSRNDIRLYLLKNDPDEEVRVRAKSAYEKNYGKLLPRKEDKNHK
jgi:hypothetical protein